jgi:ribosomal protein S18 acetylase RimI-like enzyme
MGSIHTFWYRPIQPHDAIIIHQIALEAWKYTYQSIFSEAFITEFVQQNYNPVQLEGLALAAATGSCFFNVALQNDIIVEFCHIGIRPQAQLYRIYLRPSSIGKGAGKGLLALGERFLTQQHSASYFCYVHQNNEIGKHWYLRRGFVHKEERDRDEAWFMEKALTSDF